MTGDNRPAQGERRKRPAVREVFLRACVLLAPFIKGNDKALSTSSLAMVHMVQDRFPELSGADAHIVITVAERLHRENRLQALLEDQAGAPKA